MNQPKRPTFVHWLRLTGQVSDADLRLLSTEWSNYRLGRPPHQVYTTGPITWDQFAASKYPRKVLAYQAYLRMIGAAPTFRKD